MRALNTAFAQVTAGVGGPAAVSAALGYYSPVFVASMLEALQAAATAVTPTGTHTRREGGGAALLPSVASSSFGEAGDVRVSSPSPSPSPTLRISDRELEEAAVEDSAEDSTTGNASASLPSSPSPSPASTAALADSIAAILLHFHAAAVAGGVLYPAAPPVSSRKASQPHQHAAATAAAASSSSPAHFLSSFLSSTPLHVRTPFSTPSKLPPSASILTPSPASLSSAATLHSTVSAAVEEGIRAASSLLHGGGVGAALSGTAAAAGARVWAALPFGRGGDSTGAASLPRPALAPVTAPARQVQQSLQSLSGVSLSPSPSLLPGGAAEKQTLQGGDGGVSRGQGDGGGGGGGGVSSHLLPEKLRYLMFAPPGRVLLLLWRSSAVKERVLYAAPPPTKSSLPERVASTASSSFANSWAGSGDDGGGSNSDSDSAGDCSEPAFSALMRHPAYSDVAGHVRRLFGRGGTIGGDGAGVARFRDAALVELGGDATAFFDSLILSKHMARDHLARHTAAAIAHARRERGRLLTELR